MINESLSLESTLESPSRPSKEKKKSKNKKSSFSDNLGINENKQSEIVNNNNLLDFDEIMKLVFSKQNKKSKNFIGNKRTKEINDNNIHKSKIIYLFHIIDNIRHKSDDIIEKDKPPDYINSSNNNKNKTKKINEDLYSIFNYSSSNVKIREKTINKIIQTPKYEELDEDFFEDNFIEVSIYYDNYI